jgi:CRP-like cAMP-binding protein
MAPTKKIDQTLMRRFREEFDRDEFINVLKGTTLFRDLHPRELPIATLEEIFNLVKIVPLAKNCKLNLRQSDALYEIISGYVKIYDRALMAWEKKKKNVKNPPALLAWRIPGELLGDFRFAVPDTMLDEIEATDECLLLMIPSELLRSLADRYPQIYFNIACNLAAKAIKTRVRAQILRQPNVNCMIAKMFLEFLAERGHEEEVIHDGKRLKLVKGSFKVRDIAAFLGYEYHRTQFCMHDLIKKELLYHYLSNKSGRFVCDEKGLRRYLEE